jgi:membrane protease YdiL (CAAX protease family)
LGWRGYLHVRLRGQKLAPLYVGLIWSAWHLRTVIEKGDALWQAAVFVALILVTSLWLYWLVERSGSALPAVLFHGVWNTLRNTVGLDGHADAAGRWLSSDSTALTDMEGAFGLAAMVALTALTLLALTPWLRPALPSSARR